MRRIGVDAVGVERMARALERSGAGFLARAYTTAEIGYCAGRAESLAGRWAAKEAVIKCFEGTPICFPRRRIEVLPGPGGGPRVSLLGGEARGASVEDSITHHSGLAVAAALLEMPGPELPAAASAGPMPSAPDAVVMPARPAGGHKGTFGTVVVLAGSVGLTGAAYLSATAAARAGAGMVRLLVAQSIYPILAAKCTEVMATPIGEAAPGAVGHASHDAVMRAVEPAAAFLVGPGLGRDSSTWRLVHDLVARVERPMVVDADGLNALAASSRSRGRLGAPAVFTPHPGEMARLLGVSTGEVQAGREAAALECARRWGAVAVLKGARTVVADPSGRLSTDPHEVPALASGGTGDVLAGIIAGLLAQGLRPFEAAASGVYVHGEAGRRWAGRHGEGGLLASDLLLEVPQVMDRLRRGGL
ncbi:MAG: NAD(P)H-hydrate dehydratase [Candidatus Dormibacterales bacterium]